MRFYGMDVNQSVFTESMTMRRFLVLLKGLPADSAWQCFLQDKDRYSLANYNPQKIRV